MTAAGVTTVPQITRACGTRKLGGLYLMAEAADGHCHRLPLELPTCSVCGDTIRPIRSLRKINPSILWGYCPPESGCECPMECPVCYPQSGAAAGLMWVGREYTPESFMAEAAEHGVSKRLPMGAPTGSPALPAGLVEGDPLYLVHSMARGPGRPGVFYVARIAGLQRILTPVQAADQDYVNLTRASGEEPVFEVEG